MSTKAELILAAVALGLAEADAKAKTAPQLEDFIKENGGTLPQAQTKGSKDKPEGAGTDPRTGKLVRCRIEPGHGVDGNWDVYGSVNGYNFNVKRGKEVKLDEGFVNHLKSITSTEFIPIVQNERETGEYEEVQRPRFNITILD